MKVEQSKDGLLTIFGDFAAAMKRTEIRMIARDIKRKRNRREKRRTWLDGIPSELIKR